MPCVVSELTISVGDSTRRETGTLIPGSVTMSPMLMLPLYGLSFDLDHQPRNHPLGRSDRAAQGMLLPSCPAYQRSVLCRCRF
jgi:hypothetical protein